MGESHQQATMSFDVDAVLSQLSQNEKIALLSGEALPSCLTRLLTNGGV